MEIKRFFAIQRIRFFGLSEEKFAQVLNDYVAGSAKAADLLFFYLENYTPSIKQVNAMYMARSKKVTDLYFRAINTCSRALSKYELECLVNLFPFREYQRFPQRVHSVAENRLFNERKFAYATMQAYLSSFAVSEANEIRLLELCAATGNEGKYKEILKAYIEDCPEPRLQSQRVQLKLVYLCKVGWNDLLSSLPRIANMDNNPICGEVLHYLIENEEAETIRQLLYRSYVEDKHLQQEILKHYPCLEADLKISYLRRKFRIRETSLGIRAGVLDMSRAEYKRLNMRQTINCDEQFFTQYAFEQDEDDIFFTFAYCAWVAYEYPRMRQEALRQAEESALGLRWMQADEE